MISCTTERDVVTEDSICRLVDAFYAKIRLDPELGPIFARAIPGDWQPHLNKMYAFWSSVMLTSGRYKGNPVAKHLAVEGITLKLFERWLALFDETCAELFDDRLRAEFNAKAARIAESLKLALFYRPDRPWPPQP
ncbi:MAG: hemoglobin [Bradyrhizobium sp.]|jgi:hemoglobin|nr:hemoglobin [Bradyrhizobium sp.]